MRRSWGFGHKGLLDYFLTYPLVLYSIEQQATEQHQDSTKATPKQHQDRATAQTERGQSVVALSTKTRLLIDCIFFIQFISPFAQKFKKR